MKLSLCVAVIGLLIVGALPARAGILPADRDASANWQKSGLLSVGGIPTRTTICATLSPLGGGADDTAAINAAINACQPGGVVFLNAGTFTVAEGNTVYVNQNSITLRGAGAGKTILTRTGGATVGSYVPGSNPSPIIRMSLYPNYNDSQIANLTADGTVGSTSVQVASAAGMNVGDIVRVSEASGAAWQPDKVWANEQVWASPDYRVMWRKHNPAVASDDFDASTYPYTPGSAGCWFARCDRPIAEFKQIAAISGTTITFDSPLTISYRVSNQAYVSYSSNPMLKSAGVEELTVSHGDSGNFDIEPCAYCWVKNVESTAWLNDGFDINASFRTQLEGVYVHDGVWPVPGGGGYAISLAFNSSEILIENSISMVVNKVIVARSAGAGSVVAYNYMDDGYITGNSGWIEVGVNGSHMVGSHHMLFEGNQTFNMDSDSTHGNAIYHTFFRNYSSGFRKPFTGQDGVLRDDTTGCCGPLRTAGTKVYSYWFSFIGNVLGTPGKMGSWVYDGISGTNSFPPSAIYTLGFEDISPQGYDANVAATAIRDGNYDYVTNSVHWGGASYALPNSLYLSAKPAFFGSDAWPWVNPLGTTQLAVLPAKARFDAGTPFAPPRSGGNNGCRVR